MGKTLWGFRRFPYAGRQFAWVAENRNEFHVQGRKGVAETRQRQGRKRAPQVMRRKLCGEESNGPRLLDQMFREYRLASDLTRIAVVMHSRGRVG